MTLFFLFRLRNLEEEGKAVLWIFQSLLCSFFPPSELHYLILAEIITGFM